MEPLDEILAAIFKIYLSHRSMITNNTNTIICLTATHIQLVYIVRMYENSKQHTKKVGIKEDVCNLLTKNYKITLHAVKYTEI